MLKYFDTQKLSKLGNMVSMEHNKIIILDDDFRLRELLKRFLADHEYQVTSIANSAALDRVLSDSHFDLLILDLMLPGEDGLSICQRLRANHQYIPIIMLTAKGDDSDRILGLDIGADDYVSKPFNPKELLARIQALLRRNKQMQQITSLNPESTIHHFGPFVFNVTHRTLTKNNTKISISSTEYSLLKIFTAHPNKPLTRETIMSEMSGRHHEFFDRSVDVQISRLRRLIEDENNDPQFIQTVWGIGYVFVPNLATTTE